MKWNQITIFLLLVIAMLSLNSIANAQADTLKLASLKQKSLAIADRMERELSLTPTQVHQVVQLAQERFDNLKLESPDDPTRFDKVNQKA